MKINGLKSASELAENKLHGTRIKYMAGCKCLECKAANNDYAKARVIARKQGDFNGVVSAKKARRHLLKLSKDGVGYKAVADTTDISKTVLFSIYSGKKLRCRATTERKILKVSADMAADGAYVCAKEAWLKINKLITQGYTKTKIAEGIGQKRALQLSKQQITVKHAAQIERLFETLNGKIQPKIIAYPLQKTTPTGVLINDAKAGRMVHKLR